MRLSDERDAQLDSQSSRYEERLVELHSVIAELTRQLEAKANKEEEEDEITEEAADYEEEDGEASSRAGPGSEMESRTSTDIIDAKAVEVKQISSFLY